MGVILQLHKVCKTTNMPKRFYEMLYQYFISFIVCYKYVLFFKKWVSEHIMEQNDIYIYTNGRYVVNNKTCFLLGTSSLVSTSVIYQSGDTAILPCDISVPNQANNQDELVLVMWYREDVRSPIYSIGKIYL